MERNILHFIVGFLDKGTKENAQAFLFSLLTIKIKTCITGNLCSLKLKKSNISLQRIVPTISKMKQ